MDFVIAWVDGDDPHWQKEYQKYKKKNAGDAHPIRYRDWDNLQYWFRGVEKFTPWVDKIHFVTWGHLPKWLNTDHPKLNIVNHKDFIPQNYLPTFNARPIELNLHRIKELSEEYVYFNDDMFVIDHMKEKDFFKNGHPCDAGFLSFLTGRNYDFTLMKDISIINKHFVKDRVIKADFPKWFNWKYGIKRIFSNLFLWVAKKERFPNFINFHLPVPHLKSTLNTLWEIEFGTLDESCNYKFRNYLTVNHFLQRYWSLASNNFSPIDREKLGKLIYLNETSHERAMEFITKQKRPMVCLNDHPDLYHDTNFEDIKQKVIAAFEKILPEKSKFEK